MTPARHMTGPEPKRSVSPLFHRVFCAEPLAVRRLLDEVRQRFIHLLDDDTAGRLELVLAEVLNNIVEHGSGSTARLPAVAYIHISLAQHDGGLACTISDNGVVLPGECLRPRELPQDKIIDELPEGGFGWYLIQDLTQSICYFREGHRNFLAFTMSFAEAHAS